jgi:hypothetical protein
MAVSLLAGAGGVACTVFAILRLPRDFNVTVSLTTP